MAKNKHLQHKNVRELQRLAEAAPIRGAAPRARQSSRAALLALIDILSRWSAAGLALIAGISIFLALTVGRVYPARGLAWTTLVLAALWTCRRLHRQYRAGEAVSARPFRWRAAYTAHLSVLGAAFACAPILLTPAGAPAGMAMEVMALVMIGAFGAAALHSAHVASAAAFAAPGAILPFLAALRAGEYFTLWLVLAGAGLAATATLVAAIRAGARRRNPRTALARKEAEPARRVPGLADSAAAPNAL